MRANRHFGLTALFVLALVVGGQGALANERPVANAGVLRYAGIEPVRLDGTGSYDPDASGPLSYAWRQLSGPSVVITDANTATPLISGPERTDTRGRKMPPTFVQTEALQECEFELVVSDGELASRPDTVKVVIVPSYGTNTLQLENPPFDPNKPTFLYFGGGDCTNGPAGQHWIDPGWMSSADLINWTSRANIISFSPYSPDSGGTTRTYYKYGDMTIVYLSSVAPEYHQPIQTAGASTGGQPAIDVGLRLNLTYRDARYAVNHVTFLDATRFCRSDSAYAEGIRNFLASGVDGQRCWIDNYVGGSVNLFFPGVLNLGSALSHLDAIFWYPGTPTDSSASVFNHGLAAGAYWSVVGPGKNLELASPSGQPIYVFKWTGSASSGSLDFYDESSYPGRLPEPVTLAAWINTSKASGEIDGAVLSCHYSENAVGYQLLFGSDPYGVRDYTIVSDTPTPPTDVRREFPAGETWWTIRVRDEYGSTIYADPIRLDLTTLPPLTIENARTGKRYGLVSHAIGDANSGDVIVLDPGTYDESVKFEDKTVTVRSLEPNDPVTVARTVIRGQDGSPAVTFSGPESRGCVLAGLTIQSATVGISCRDAVPTIRNCVVECPNSVAVEFWWGCDPNLIDCTVLGQVKEGGDPGLIAYWRLDEASGVVAADIAGTHDGTLVGDPLWQPVGGMLGGALQLDGVDDYIATTLVLDPTAGPFSVFAWVKGGAPGQAILSRAGGANWLVASSPDGALMTDLKSTNRKAKALTSSVVIVGGEWHRVGLSWDGSNRILYVDESEVARDAPGNLAPSTGGLYIGAGSTLAAGSFWSGLIDDVRIYDRAVTP
jgi:hypothetical protein